MKLFLSQKGGGFQKCSWSNEDLGAKPPPYQLGQHFCYAKAGLCRPNLYFTVKIKIFCRLKFMKPFSIAKRFHTSKNALGAMKTLGRCPNTPPAFKKAGPKLCIGFAVLICILRYQYNLSKIIFLLT